MTAMFDCPDFERRDREYCSTCIFSDECGAEWERLEEKEKARKLNPKKGQTRLV